MSTQKKQTEKIAAVMRLLVAAPQRNNRLPPGRCACGEVTVLWCTRHGQPVKAA